jgi:hypothetical protein
VGQKGGAAAHLAGDLLPPQAFEHPQLGTKKLPKPAGSVVVAMPESSPSAGLWYRAEERRGHQLGTQYIPGEISKATIQSAGPLSHYWKSARGNSAREAKTPCNEFFKAFPGLSTWEPPSGAP